MFSFKPVLLYIIYTVEKMFAGKKIAVIYLVGTIFADPEKKTQKSQTLDAAKF